MFVKLTLTKNVYMKPADLGPALMHALERRLREAVEGQRVPKVGRIVAVVDIVDDSSKQGKILDTGEVLFQIRYVAVVFRLWPGETVDCIVTDVDNDGFLVDAGATSVYVSQYQMPTTYAFENNGAESRFVTGDGALSIAKGECVRLKIMSETPSNERFGAIGSIKGAYFGPRM
jgi:DNA-directed RNA polymerase II subunit RPB7